MLLLQATSVMLRNYLTGLRVVRVRVHVIAAFKISMLKHIGQNHMLVPWNGARNEGPCRRKRMALRPCHVEC